METGSISIRLAADIRVSRGEVPEHLMDLLVRRLTWRNPLHGKNVRWGKPVEGDVPETLSGIRQAPESGEVILPKGFLSELIRLCHAHRYAPVLVDGTPQGLAAAMPELEDRNGLSGHQAAMLRRIGELRFGILEAPPGSGKRAIMVRLAMRERMPLLAVVSTLYELHAWKETCLRAGWAREHVGLVGGGLQEPGRPVTILLGSRLKSEAVSDALRSTGLLVLDRVDQVHLGHIFFGGRVNCRMQWGLSVGPRSDGLTGLMEAYVGPRLPWPQERAEGRLPLLKIASTGFECADGGGEWRHLVASLGKSRERNRLIAADVLQAVALGLRCLVVSDRGTHLQAIGEAMREAMGPDLEVLSAEASEAHREELLKRFNANRKGMAMGLVFRSAAMAEHIERIDACMIAAPVKQADYLMGIVMRMGKEGVVYEYKDRERLLKRSLSRRVKVYRRLGMQNAEYSRQ